MPLDPQLQYLLQTAGQGGPGPRQPGSLPMPQPSGFVPERAPQMPALGGPFGLSGEALDALAQQVLRSSQQFQPRSDFEGFLSGLAGGLAGTRVQSMNERQAFNAGEQERALERTKGNVEFEKERRKQISEAARSLGTHRQQLASDKALAEQKASEEKLQREWEAQQKALDRAAYGFRGGAGGRGGGAGSGGGGDLGIDPDTEAIVDAIASFRADPKLGNRYTKESSKIRAALYRKYPNFNMSKAITDWDQKVSLGNATNSQRFIANRAAVATVEAHLKDYERFNKEFDAAYKRTPLRFANVGILQAAKQGFLGERAANAAAQLETNRGALSAELATVLSGGYAPQEIHLKDAHKVIDPLWGPNQQGKAIATVKRLIQGRVNASQNVRVFSGAEANPYTQPASGINVFGERFPSDSSSTAQPPPASWDQFRRSK